MNKPSTAKKITTMALLATVALIIFVIEAQIPSPVPIPGVKLGLANIVTVYSMFALGPAPTLAVLLCRIILGSIFAGQAVSFMYSLAGGLMCFAAMALLRRVLSPGQIWVCSVIGAVFHNLGQIIVAMLLTGSAAVAAYLPVLMVSGIIAGLFTGIAAQLLVGRLGRGRP